MKRYAWAARSLANTASASRRNPFYRPSPAQPKCKSCATFEGSWTLMASLILGKCLTVRQAERRCQIAGRTGLGRKLGASAGRRSNNLCDCFVQIGDPWRLAQHCIDLGKILALLIE